MQESNQYTWKTNKDFACGLATDLRLNHECSGARHPSNQPNTLCCPEGGTQNTMECALATSKSITVEVYLGLAKPDGAVPSSSPPQPVNREA